MAVCWTACECVRAGYCVSMNVQRHKNLRNQKERNFQKNKDGSSSSSRSNSNYNNSMATKYTTMPNKNRMYEEIQRQTTIETSQLKQIWVYQQKEHRKKERMKERNTEDRSIRTSIYTCNVNGLYCVCMDCGCIRERRENLQRNKIACRAVPCHGFSASF